MRLETINTDVKGARLEATVVVVLISLSETVIKEIKLRPFSSSVFTCMPVIVMVDWILHKLIAAKRSIHSSSKRSNLYRVGV